MYVNEVFTVTTRSFFDINKTFRSQLSYFELKSQKSKTEVLGTFYLDIAKLANELKNGQVTYNSFIVHERSFKGNIIVDIHLKLMTPYSQKNEFKI